MLNFNVIGNLAADAEVKNFSSGDYVCFRVAHNFRTADGAEKTLWVSCFLRGTGGKLMEYLKKGALVFVCGRGSARTFSSHVTKQFEVGLDIQVDRIELLGGRPKITAESLLAALNDKHVILDDVKKVCAEFESEQPF